MDERIPKYVEDERRLRAWLLLGATIATAICIILSVVVFSIGPSVPTPTPIP